MFMAYEDLRDDLHTGDIVLFSGRGAVSSLIRWVTLSHWSHVGLVLRYEPDAVFIWEATVRKGVALSAFSRRVQRYDGQVAVRLLDRSQRPERGQPLDDSQLKAVHEFRREVSGTGFERSAGQMLRAAWRRNRADESRFFCSELVAATLKRARILPAERPSNDYTPSDFAGEFRTAAGYAYRREVRIK